MRLGALTVLLFAVLALPQGALAATNTISTVAGGAIVRCLDEYCNFDNGDGGPATAAVLTARTGWR